MTELEQAQPAPKPAPRSKRKAEKAIVEFGEDVQEAARDFALVCAQLDQADDDDKFETLATEFAAARAVVEGRIERFAELRRLLRDKATEDRALAKALTARAARVDALIHRVDQALCQRIQADPENPTWAGERKRLSVQANGGVEALVVTLAAKSGTPATRKVTLPNVLDAETSLDLEDRFVETVTYTVLNKEAVREALEAGEKLGWARLERGVQLRIRNA